MTTTLPIPGGLSNREIIETAYLAVGLSDAMFGRTAEELTSGMTLLRGMMGEWPFDQLDFDDSVASIEEESGIERKWLTAVGYSLGERIGATIGGGGLKPGSQVTLRKAYSRLCAAFGPSQMDYANGTPRGAGAKSSFDGPFFAEVE